MREGGGTIESMMWMVRARTEGGIGPSDRQRSTHARRLNTVVFASIRGEGGRERERGRGGEGGGRLSRHALGWWGRCKAGEGKDGLKGTQKGVPALPLSCCFHCRNKVGPCASPLPLAPCFACPLLPKSSPGESLQYNALFHPTPHLRLYTLPVCPCLSHPSPGKGPW